MCILTYANTLINTFSCDLRIFIYAHIYGTSYARSRIYSQLVLTVVLLLFDDFDDTARSESFRTESYELLRVFD